MQIYKEFTAKKRCTFAPENKHLRATENLGNRCSIQLSYGANAHVESTMSRAVLEQGIPSIRFENQKNSIRYSTSGFCHPSQLDVNAIQYRSATNQCNVLVEISSINQISLVIR